MMQFHTEVIGGEVVLTSVEGEDEVVTIPSEVTVIGDPRIRGSVNDVGVFAWKGIREVRLPEGLKRIGRETFKKCSSLQTISLPEGLEEIGFNAFEGCSSLQMLTLPDRVKNISIGAFWECSNLQTITLPQGLKEIGGFAFLRCSSLQTIILPEGLEEIGQNAFEGCRSLQSITLPKGLERIGWRTFYGCRSLQTITLPEELKRIEKEAFSGCSNLQTINLLNAHVYLEKDVFSGCDHLHTVNIDLRTVDCLSDEISDLNLKPTDEEIAYVALYQKSERWEKWLNWLKIDNPVHVFNCMIELWLQDRSVSSNLTSFMLDHITSLQPGQVQQVVAILQKRDDEDELQRIMKHPEVVLLSKGEPIPEHPIEVLVRKLTPLYAEEIEQVDEIVNGVRYADSEIRSSRDAVLLLIAASFREANNKIDNIDKSYSMYNHGKLCLDEDVLRVAKALNRSELLEQLMDFYRNAEAQREKYSQEMDYRGRVEELVELYRNAEAQREKYRLAWALLADDASIREETKSFKAKRAGKSRPDEEKEVLRFLIHNDSLAAMQLFDRLNMLDEYAQLRGMTGMELRDSALLPDFHFDADGVKRYDIGGNTIEVRVTPELKFQLYDVKKGKELRSFPKKSDDPEKLAACAAEYDSFKKKALAFAKERAQRMHEMYMSGEFIPLELWRKVYVEHPLIQHLSQLVVWEDKVNHTFMIVNGETIDSQGLPYSPQGAICVAHVLDMTAEDIRAWQLWLAHQGRKQLFEQVWEPVIHWNEKELWERYKGVVLSSSAFLAVKKNLKQHGVDVWEEELYRLWTVRTRVMHFGHCLSLDLYDRSETAFGTAKKVDSKNYRRELNAVLLEMDRAAISAQILKDNDVALTDAALASFTAAQISEFLNLAIDQKCTRCTAKLLDYKNQRFPEFSEMDEFTLDW